MGERVLTLNDIRLVQTTVAGLGAVTVRQSIHATREVEDWSRCRSRSRAERRLKQGHCQNMRVVRRPAAMQIGNEIIVHPEIMSRIRERMDQEMQSRMLYGGTP